MVYGFTGSDVQDSGLVKVNKRNAIVNVIGRKAKFLEPKLV